MCQYRFTSCKKYTRLVGDVDNGRGYGCVGAEIIWEIFVAYTQFCCEVKTHLRNKAY